MKYPRTTGALLFGLFLSIASTGWATLITQPSWMKVFETSVGKFERAWDGKAASSYHGKFLMHGSQFHLTEELQIADVYDSITTFWVFSYKPDKKKYVAWLFVPNIEDPTPIYFEGDWDAKAKCLTLHKISSGSSGGGNCTFYPPSKETPYPRIEYAAIDPKDSDSKKAE